MKPFLFNVGDADKHTQEMGELLKGAFKILASPILSDEFHPVPPCHLYQRIKKRLISDSNEKYIRCPMT